MVLRIGFLRVRVERSEHFQNVQVFAAIPCLKNLMIETIIFASSSSLGAKVNLNENGLKVGPLNNNSMLGFITIPVVLANNC